MSLCAASMIRILCFFLVLKQIAAAVQGGARLAPCQTGCGTDNLFSYLSHCVPLQCLACLPGPEALSAFCKICNFFSSPRPVALGSARLGSRKGATTCVSHDVRLLCQQAVKAYEADTPAVPAGGSRGASARLVKGGNASPPDPLKTSCASFICRSPFFFPAPLRRARAHCRTADGSGLQRFS